MSVSIKNLMHPGDIHFVVSKSAQSLKLFNSHGNKEWECEARCWGQHRDWRSTNGDTPPGLYRIGTIYDTSGETPYGRWCIDLEDLENQETGNGRGGISLHGGGSGLPSPFSPHQGWVNAHGCVRVQNVDLERIVAMVKKVKASGHKAYLTVVG